MRQFFISHPRTHAHEPTNCDRSGLRATAGACTRFVSQHSCDERAAGTSSWSSSSSSFSASESDPASWHGAFFCSSTCQPRKPNPPGWLRLPGARKLKACTMPGVAQPPRRARMEVMRFALLLLCFCFFALVTLSRSAAWAIHLSKGACRSIPVSSLLAQQTIAESSRNRAGARTTGQPTSWGSCGGAQRLAAGSAVCLD